MIICVGLHIVACSPVHCRCTGAGMAPVAGYLNFTFKKCYTEYTVTVEQLSHIVVVVEHSPAGKNACNKNNLERHFASTELCS